MPLALLLSAPGSRHPDDRATVAHDTAQRFSALGIGSVAILATSGAINAWLLVGSLTGLVATAYGRLLMIKLSLFALMLVFASVNRLVLTPRLASSAAQPAALHQLTRNSIIEIILGLMIFTIVGALGTMHPAVHLVS